MPSSPYRVVRHQPASIRLPDKFQQAANFFTNE
ncbi:hypothetical protein T03_8456 [Trichinella britovi]|uniref:Uncharacterized protein n=1 Tax=Trichinella britovi TaxID=45882 RepID=A0A0V0YQZ4_TRIBR|nr:hypothetical protein T03_8456 [Trichinella britovi]